jgi:hypothetical protein
MDLLSDDMVRTIWRSVSGPKAELNGPLIRFAGRIAMTTAIASGVWACRRCGRLGKTEQCPCGGSLGLTTSDAAFNLFCAKHEPDSGWHDHSTAHREWMQSGEASK